MTPLNNRMQINAVSSITNTYKTLEMGRDPAEDKALWKMMDGYVRWLHIYLNIHDLSI